MNYEELLESRNGAALKKEPLPFGSFYKKMQDKKYVNVVDINHVLLTNTLFCDALVAESKQVTELKSRHQLHYTVSSDSAGIYGLLLESGNFHTFKRLLFDNPAVIAEKGFVDSAVKQVLEAAQQLHEQNIFHVCYSPDNIFIRRGDNMLMLLLHGSSYSHIRDKKLLYGDVEDYIAPEVLDGGIADDRSDIFSIGKFIEFLYQESEIPLEQKSVLKKATDPDPDKRYQTIAEMQAALRSRSNARKTLMTIVGAVVATILVVSFFFSMMPEQDDIEYVEPVKEVQPDDLLDDGFDPSTELGMAPDTTAERVDDKKIKEYEAKAEQIFRKQFSKEAERILSKVYNNERMNADENAFMTLSSSANAELLKKQSELSGQAGLNDTKAQRIASDIIDQVTNRLKSKMSSTSNSKGIQRESPTEETQVKSMVEPIKNE